MKKKEPHIKLICSILCCFLTFGNTAIGKHFVFCKTGSGITVEIEHASHCESDHSENHKHHSDHNHNYEIEHGGDCSPCSDIRLIIEASLPRNESLVLGTSVTVISPIHSLYKTTLSNTFLPFLLIRYNPEYPFYYPAETVLRI